jgi:hypothetical protein
MLEKPCERHGEKGKRICYESGSPLESGGANEGKEDMLLITTGMHAELASGVVARLFMSLNGLCLNGSG